MPKIRAMDMEELGNKEFCLLIFSKTRQRFLTFMHLQVPHLIF